MKKFKVLKPVTIDGTDYAVDAIVDLEDQAAIDAMLADGIIEAYTEASTDEHRSDPPPGETRKQPVTWKTRSADTSVRKSSSKKMLVSAFVAARQQRAAADYAGTEVTDVLGLLKGGNQLLNLCTLLPIRGNLNIVFADWSDGNPAIGLVAEGASDSSQVDLAQYAAIPGKYKATVPVPTEYLEDTPGMDVYVRAALSRSAGIGVDLGIISGAFTNSKGLRGIIGSTDYAATGAVGLANVPVTKAQIDDLIGLVYAECYNNLTIAFNPLAWAAFVATLNPTNTCCGEVVTGKNPSYRGWPVILTSAVPVANKLVVGDFSQYLVGVSRTITVETDKSAGFADDTVLYRVTARLAGGISGSKDENGYSFFAYGLAAAGTPE